MTTVYPDSVREEMRETVAIRMKIPGASWEKIVLTHCRRVFGIPHPGVDWETLMLMVWNRILHLPDFTELEVMAREMHKRSMTLSTIDVLHAVLAVPHPFGVTYGQIDQVPELEDVFTKTVGPAQAQFRQKVESFQPPMTVPVVAKAA